MWPDLGGLGADRVDRVLRPSTGSPPDPAGLREALGAQSDETLVVRLAFAELRSWPSTLGVMSASKLEKTVVNLEKRLKQEFHAEMQRELKQHTAGLEARLSTLEAQLKKIQTEPLVVCDIDRVSDIVEERLDRGDLNLPEAHLALEAKESVAPLELDAVAPEGGEERSRRGREADGTHP
ncbi:unnamed protein product [Durusdinium trenchii]|uniref:Uncharacterized protein n=1 Tax=Durusdinium trenchii TaxID=1381693 RepID=A0ABP0NTN0_9DINO